MFANGLAAPGHFCLAHPVAQTWFNMTIWTEIRVFWRSIVFVFTPVVFMALPIANTSMEARTAYGVLVLAVYWMTEAIPLAATALLPIVIFPLLGVQTASVIAKNYLKDTNMLVLGGLMVAVSIENCNLHKRIALMVLRLVGTQPKWVMLGFMLPTWALSMWISNTATTAMMFAVAHAVLDQIDLHRQNNDQLTAGRDNKGFTDSHSVGDGLNLRAITTDREMEEPNHVRDELKEHDSTEKQDKKQAEFEHFRQGLCLSIAYAANVGGIATLTGTGTNLILKNTVDDVYANKGLESPITFTSWMTFGMPTSCVCLAVTWLWMQTHFVGLKSLIFCKQADVGKSVKEIIHEEYRALGPFSFAEWLNVLCFTLLACLWLFRDPKFIPGWGSFFRKGYVSDSSAVLFVAILLFALPSVKPRLASNDGGDTSVPSKGLLDWESIHVKVPWGVIILIGGGFALADVCRTSGLSALIGRRLVSLEALPSWLIVMLITSLVTSLTEFTSNVATASLLLPILAQMADELRLHPLYLMFPATLATSFAFMLPVATPPNAIVFAAGYIRVADMAKAGFVLNILCMLVAVTAVHTWGMALFQLQHPLDSPVINSTAVIP